MVKKVSYKFDPWKLLGVEKPKTGSKAVREEIADYLLDEILLNVGKANSPVKGHGRFKGLSKDYKKVKAEESSSVIANMELTGAMLDDLEVVATGDGKIEVRIAGDEAPKADNHNKFSSESKKTPVPMRRFIPKGDDGETFKRDIIKGMREIAKDAIDG